ncbi:PEP-CTERM sorting domain-containing protein [Aquabacterium sp.]|uniref:PEP-CTERM sorting domain-containing protein n=1 Tax=Aquabacterium sp. TaxID=1872578 RepID=UPI003D6D9079
MKLQTIVAVVALAVTGIANASINQATGATSTTAGDGSLIFVNLDSTGDKTQSLTVDLGYTLSQFAAGAAFTGANQKIVWNFNDNTITQNGTVLAGITNAWAAQRSIFLANSDAGESKWAILAGSQKSNTPVKFLASGTPDDDLLTQQGGANTANFVQINTPLVKTLVDGNKGTILSADNGAYAAGSTDSSYVGATTTYGTTDFNGWRNNIKWSTWSDDGASTNLTQLNPNGSEVRIGDSSLYEVAAGFQLDTSNTLNGQATFTYDSAAGTLTYQTAIIAASVPEPESYALALIGLAAVGFVARRRAAK